MQLSESSLVSRTVTVHVSVVLFLLHFALHCITEGFKISTVMLMQFTQQIGR